MECHQNLLAPFFQLLPTFQSDALITRIIYIAEPSSLKWSRDDLLLTRRLYYNITLKARHRKSHGVNALVMWFLMLNSVKYKFISAHLGISLTEMILYLLKREKGRLQSNDLSLYK
jgi:hypothetical protein